MAQPGNLLSDNNESLETSVAGWGVIATCTLAQSATHAFIGAQALGVTSTASTPAMNFSSATQGDQPQGLVAGTSYDAYVWVYSTIASRTAWWTIDWRTSGNVYISTTDQTAAKINLTQNDWTLVYFNTGAAPATTTQATLNFNITQSATSQVYWCDLFFFGMMRPKIVRPSTLQAVNHSNLW
jgi:hypothetical protein